MNAHEKYQGTAKSPDDTVEFVPLEEREKMHEKISVLTALAIEQQKEIKGLRNRVSEFESLQSVPVPERATGAEAEAARAEHEKQTALFLNNRDIAGLLGYMEQRERIAAERAAKDASRDPLTGLPNRRSFDEDAGKLFSKVLEYNQYLDFLKQNPGERERRSHEPPNPGDFSVVMADLDGFKTINDTYGHAAGDEVLKHVADILREKLRPTDEIARYGGHADEFVVAFNSPNPGARLIVAEKIRKAIEKADIQFKGKPISLTASVGAAKWKPGASMSDVAQSADAALYEAKRRGRNQSMVDSFLEGEALEKKK